MKLATLLLGIGIIALLVFASRPRHSTNPSSVTEIESYIEKSVARNTPPGISIVVIKN